MTLVIVPYRADGGHRDRLWAHLHTHYWSRLPYEVARGEHTDGPFNRSAAINTAAARRWGVAVVADADTWVPPRQLAAAITIANRTGRLVAAFTSVVELDRQCTEALLAGRGDITTLGVERIRTAPLEIQSSMLVIPRRLWDAVGPFDTRFRGWGGEDNAWWHAATLIGGQPRRVDGPAFHLWHEPGCRNKNTPEYRANLALWQRYAATRTVEQLRAVQR